MAELLMSGNLGGTKTRVLTDCLLQREWEKKINEKPQRWHAVSDEKTLFFFRLKGLEDFIRRVHNQQKEVNATTCQSGPIEKNAEIWNNYLWSVASVAESSISLVLQSAKTYSVSIWFTRVTFN